MGDDADEEDDAVEGRDRVTIPRFVVPSLVDDAAIIISIDLRRWLRPIVVSNLEQVISISFTDVANGLDHLDERFRRSIS